MWRAGLRIGGTLALTDSDLDADRGAILVRHGKGNKRRDVGMASGDGSCCARGWLNVIQRQLGHANLGITSVYLQGIDNAEILDASPWLAPMAMPQPRAQTWCADR